MAFIGTTYRRLRAAAAVTGVITWIWLADGLRQALGY